MGNRKCNGPREAASGVRVPLHGPTATSGPGLFLSYPQVAPIPPVEARYERR